MLCRRRNRTTLVIMRTKWDNPTNWTESHHRNIDETELCVWQLDILLLYAMVYRYRECYVFYMVGIIGGNMRTSFQVSNFEPCEFPTQEEPWRTINIHQTRTDFISRVFKINDNVASARTPHKTVQTYNNNNIHTVFDIVLSLDVCADGGGDGGSRMYDLFSIYVYYYYENEIFVENEFVVRNNK